MENSVHETIVLPSDNKKYSICTFCKDDSKFPKFYLIDYDCVIRASIGIFEPVYCSLNGSPLSKEDKIKLAEKLANHPFYDNKHSLWTWIKIGFAQNAENDEELDGILDHLNMPDYNLLPDTYEV